jgi:hypothetical protein
MVHQVDQAVLAVVEQVIMTGEVMAVMALLILVEEAALNTMGCKSLVVAVLVLLFFLSQHLVTLAQPQEAQQSQLAGQTQF